MEDGRERLRGCLRIGFLEAKEEWRGFLEAKGSDGDDCEVDERFIARFGDGLAVVKIFRDSS